MQEVIKYRTPSNDGDPVFRDYAMGSNTFNYDGVRRFGPIWVFSVEPNVS